MSRPMSDARRRVLRRWLLIGLVPVALVALVVASKLISVSVLGQVAVDRFQARAYAQSAEASRALEGWNWVEPWKAPFNLGVALVMGGELVEGRAELEEALGLHPEPVTAAQRSERCVIVATIVTAIEKQGDEAREADDQQTANRFYQEALSRIDGAPEGCFDEPMQGRPDTGAQLEAADPRIQEKLEQGDGSGDGEPTEPSPEEQLDQQNQDAQTEQQQQDSYDEGEGGGPSVERPW